MDTVQLQEDYDVKKRKALNAKLMTPFPSEAIKTRKGAGGKDLRYVEGFTVINRLIAATDNQYDFSILGRDLFPFGDKQLAVAHVRLCIPGLGCKEHIGVQIVSEREGNEDVWKGAVTDALKKAATLHGVGQHLYGKNNEVVSPRLEVSRLLRRSGINTPEDANQLSQQRWGLDIGKLNDVQFEEWAEELK